MVQAQQMLDGIQHKVEGEIRKGMDCLAQAKAELQVCLPFIVKRMCGNSAHVASVSPLQGNNLDGWST